MTDPAGPLDEDGDPHSREALEEVIAVADWDEAANHTTLMVARLLLQLLDLEESEFCRRSQSLAFVTDVFTGFIRQLKSMHDLQGELFMAANRIPDAAPRIFEEMERAYRTVSERLRQSIEEIQGTDEWGTIFLKTNMAYMAQMLEDLATNPPEEEMA